MKVVLTAFDEKLTSKVMEYPDATKDEIQIALPFANFQIMAQGKDASDFPRDVRGRFQATGQYLDIKNEMVAIYALMELSGCNCGLVRSLKEQVDELEEEVELRDEEDKRRSINSLTDADFGL